MSKINVCLLHFGIHNCIPVFFLQSNTARMLRLSCIVVLATFPISTIFCAHCFLYYFVKLLSHEDGKSGERCASPWRTFRMRWRRLVVLLTVVLPVTAVVCLGTVEFSEIFFPR